MVSSDLATGLLLAVAGSVVAAVLTGEIEVGELRQNAEGAVEDMRSEVR